MFHSAEMLFHLWLSSSMRDERQWYLFGTACCRLVWPLIVADDCCRRWVELIEREFDEDSHIDLSEEANRVRRGVTAASDIPLDDGPEALRGYAGTLVNNLGQTAVLIDYLVRPPDPVAEWGDPKERARQVAALLRDIIGNPYRPVPLNPSWLTTDVTALASGIYADRAFERLPILADALQDAGCDNPDILTHCRGAGPHVRGCWVVDLLLGKS
jgi:hypothetical protein